MILLIPCQVGSLITDLGVQDKHLGPHVECQNDTGQPLCSYVSSVNELKVGRTLGQSKSQVTSRCYRLLQAKEGFPEPDHCFIGLGQGLPFYWIFFLSFFGPKKLVFTSDAGIGSPTFTHEHEKVTGSPVLEDGFISNC